MSAEAKQQLREQLKQERANADTAELSICDACISASVQDLPEFQAAPVVLTYLSFGREVDTRALIQEVWDQGKQVALPKCQPGGLMTWHFVDSFEGLISSSFGMDEPDESRHLLVDVASLESDSVALVPGLAFDADGYRLGYGGGFYDRFLVDFPGISIGLCRASDLYESLQDLDVVDLHDVPVNTVVSNTGSFASSSQEE